jgi:hypothetical protein
MVYDMTAGEKRLASVDPAAASAPGLEVLGLGLAGYWPDHAAETIVTPGEPGADTVPAAELGEKGWVFDRGGPDGGSVELDGGRRLAFFWDQERATAYVARTGRPGAKTPHRLVLGGEAVPVEVGGTYPVPGTDRKVRVIRAFSDFVMDTQTRAPANRSDRPDNPAVEVAVLAADGKELIRTWLFARFPGFHRQDESSPAAGLGYTYLGEAGALGETQALLVGEVAEIWTLRDGAVAGRRPVPDDDRSPVRVSGLHPAVRITERDVSRSAEPLNPAVRVRVRGQEAPVLVRARKPARIPGGRVLVLAPKGGDTVRDYLSTVSVIEEGREVLTRVVEVNDPLQYGGYAVYQADYRPDDPDFSGFEIVRDPGIHIVYLGLLVNAAGVLCVMFVAPLLGRKRARAKEPEALA